MLNSVEITDFLLKLTGLTNWFMVHVYWNKGIASSGMLKKTTGVLLVDK